MKLNIIKTIILFASMQGIAVLGEETPGSPAPGKYSLDSVSTEQPCVALTFDDGPSSMLTPQLLKVLADHNAKATFFLAGEAAQNYPALVRQEAAAGHEIASRSWSRTGFSKLTDEQWRTDLVRTDRAIKTAIGRSPRLFRPFNTTDFGPSQSEWASKEFGYQTIYWSVDSSAFKSMTPAAIAENIVAQVKPGSIISATDLHTATVQAIPLIIDALTAKGYKFVTVTDLMALAGSPAASRTKESKPIAYEKPGKQKYNQPSASAASHPYGTVRPSGNVVIPDMETGS